MDKRADAIDVLRCLAIVGMVFSGQIAWTQGLPAWMHHAQLPPPTFAFDPAVPGITWVDLVFPFFIFTMGAAIPLSLRRKLESGCSTLNISAGIVKRGLLLVLFAIVLGNAGYSQLTQQFGPLCGSAATILTWILLSAMFIRFPKSGREINDKVNIAGGILLVALIALFGFGFGLPLSLYSNDAIIHILATLAVTGGLLWLWTRDDIKSRIFLTAFFAAVKISLETEGSWLAQIAVCPSLCWLTSSAYIKYLCILIPGTIAGDMVWRWMKLSRTDNAGPSGTGRETIAGLLMGTTVIVTLWAMFSRQISIGAVWTVLSGAAVVCMLKKKNADNSLTLHYRLASIGFMLLITGFVLEPFEGGIRKDDATLSYLFTTGGQASYTLAAISILSTRTRFKAGFLRDVGRNPMIAYTAAGFVILPVLTLAGLSGPLARLAAAGPVGGITRGIIVTLAAMAVTWTFTKNKIYWKT